MTGSEDVRLMAPGSWTRFGGSLWVRPPEGPAVRLCLLTRVVRQDPSGPTVVGEIRSGGRRWVLFNGRFAEVAG